MYRLTYLSSKFFSFSIIQLTVLLLFLTTTSCDCSPNKKGTSIRNGSLLMEVPDPVLVGNQKTIEVIFTLNGNSKATSLKNFILKANYTKGRGKLSYTTFKGRVSITETEVFLEKSIAELTSAKELLAGKGPIKVSFTIVPAENVTQATIKLELYDKLTNTIKDIDVKWKEDPKPIQLELTPNGNTDVKGNTPVSLKITNKQGYLIEAGKLKLKITRTKGLSTGIAGATTLGNGEYKLDLPALAPNGSINQDLIIVPDKDVEATFKCQLIYNGKEVKDAKSVNINWEKEVPLILKSIEFNKITNQLVCTIENTNSEPLEQVKLIYKNKTSGIKLGELELNEFDTENTIDLIDNLDPKSKEEHFNLGKLDFGTNSKAEFEFALIYKGSAPTFKSYTFTPIDIKLGLELTYDQNLGQVAYTIKNTGTEEGSNVKLIYTNVSEKPSERNVLLANQRNGETSAVSLAATTGITTGMLPLQFVTEEKATFEFKVAYEGAVLTHLTQAKEFLAPKVELELVPIGVNILAREIDVEEPNKEVKVKINTKVGTPLADHNQLKLVITPIIGDRGYLSKSVGGPKITELVGNQLGNIGDEIILYLNPDTDEKLDFKLELFYKNKSIPNPILVSWKAKEVDFRLNLVEPILPNHIEQDPRYVNLEESVEFVKLKIEQVPGSDIVDINQVKLVISRTLGNTGFLSRSKESNSVSELVGDQLGKLGDEITLYVNPQGDEKLEFKLQVYYKEKSQHVPLRLSWGKDKLRMKDLNTFDEDGEASFVIENNSGHRISKKGYENMEVEIKSNNRSEFTLLNRDVEVGKVAALSEFGKHIVNSIRFKLKDAHGEKESIVTVTIRKKGAANPLDSKQIVWREQGNIEVYLDKVVKGGYISIGGIDVYLLNTNKSEIDTAHIKLRLLNTKGLDVRLNHKVYHENSSPTLQEIVVQDRIGVNRDIVIGLDIVGHPTAMSSRELELVLEDNNGVFYQEKLIFINESKLIVSCNALDKELETVQFAEKELSNNIKLKAKDSGFRLDFYVKNVLKMQSKSQQLKENAEALLNTLPDPWLANKYEPYIRKNILAPAADALEKANEFLKDYMQSAEDDVKKLLETDQLDKVCEVLISIGKIYLEAFKTQENKEKVIAIFNALMQRLDSKTQDYATNTSKQYHASEAIQIGKVAADMVNNSEEIAKVCNLNITKVVEISKVAYLAAVQAKLAKISVIDNHKVDNPQHAFTPAIKAARIAKQARARGVTSKEITQAATKAYIAAAQAELTRVNYAKEAILKYPSLSVYSSAQILDASNIAAKVAQRAKIEGFEDNQTNLAAKDAYISAAQAQLAIANYYKSEISKFVIPSVQKYEVKKPLNAVNDAAEIAKAAKENGFLSEETNQIIKETYEAVLAIYKDLNTEQQTYNDIINQIKIKIQQLS